MFKRHLTKDKKVNFSNFLSRCAIKFGDRFDYSKVVWVNSKSKLIIICPVHGEFRQTPSNHLKSVYGCTECGTYSLKYTTDEYIKKCSQRHNYKYLYTKTFFTGSERKVIITCQKHGDFEQQANSHLAGIGCPKCAIEESRKGIDKFIEQANLKHNFRYSYTKSEYLGCDKKITILCYDHGDFSTTPSQHLSGTKCPKCAWRDNQYTTEEFIKIARCVHGDDTYIYDLVDCLNGDHVKVTIICPSHGTFEQKPFNHLHGRGCFKCAARRVIELCGDKFITDAENVHGVGTYDYKDLNYTGSANKIVLYCKKHGKFEIVAGKHLSGQGCLECFCIANYSKISLEWLKYMSSQRNEFIQHAGNIGEFFVPDTRYKADGYCKDSNTVFEFHGSYFHGDPRKYNSGDINPTSGITYGELYQKTLLKEKKIRELGYNYIEMWESEWLTKRKDLGFN